MLLGTLHYYYVTIKIKTIWFIFNIPLQRYKWGLQYCQCSWIGQENCALKLVTLFLNIFKNFCYICSMYYSFRPVSTFQPLSVKIYKKTSKLFTIFGQVRDKINRHFTKVPYTFHMPDVRSWGSSMPTKGINRLLL